MSHVKTRVGLVALEAILALTAIVSAFTVIPSLPPEWIKGSAFADYTIPAIALGVLVGGSAVVAALAVVIRPALGAAASIVAGLMIIGFELVEMVVVGFSLVVYGPGMPQAWLQVVYIALGAAIAILGARLWLALGGRIPKFRPARPAPAAPRTTITWPGR
jgi:hypothetical protein